MSSKHPKDYMKKRRKRTIISPEQLRKLEYSFKKEAWPDRIRKSRLAREVGTPESFISVWFQNRRARARRENEPIDSFIFGSPEVIRSEEPAIQHAQDGSVSSTSRKPGSKPGSRSPLRSRIESSRFPHDYESSAPPGIHAMRSTFSGHIKKPHDKKRNKKKKKSHKVGGPKELGGSHPSYPASGPAQVTCTDGTKGLDGDTSTQQSVDQHPDTKAKSLTPQEGGDRAARPRTLFEAIVGMVAVAEGVTSPGEAGWEASVNDGLYGINLGGAQLVTDPDLGLDLLPMDP